MYICSLLYDLLILGLLQDGEAAKRGGSEKSILKERTRGRASNNEPGKGLTLCSYVNCN